MRRPRRASARVTLEKHAYADVSATGRIMLCAPYITSTPHAIFRLLMFSERWSMPAMRRRHGYL